MAGYKLPSDAMVVANQKENTTIQDFSAQSADPITTIKEATRQSLFASKQTEVTERIAEIISVRSNITLPAELSYFGEQQISEEYKKQKWYCAICRILDLHGVTPDPDIIVDASSGMNSFKDITRMRLNIGKFYCPVEALEGKGRKPLKIGQWLVVEFQDKTLMTNGIIKDVYISPDLSREEAADGNEKTASEAIAEGETLPYGTVLDTAPMGAMYINPLGDIAATLTSDYTLLRESTGRPHRALDIVNGATNQSGVTPIYAIAPGEVTRVWEGNEEVGNAVEIKHSSGASRYCHLASPVSFSVGDKIENGQMLGYMGNTGNIIPGPGGTGVHLHLIIYDAKGNPIDGKTVINFTPWTPGNPPTTSETPPTNSSTTPT